MAVGIGELRMSLASVDAFVPLENVTRSVSDDDGSSQCIHDVITFTIEPLVTHHLVLQVNIDQLRELQSEPDSQGLGEVGHRPDQAVIVVKEVIIQPLGVRVTLHTLDEMI